MNSKLREIREHKVSSEAGSKSISFSQLSLYTSCPYKWYRAYVKKEAPFQPSIHLIFGTAMHETIQHWLDVLYNDTAKAADSLDLNNYLLDRMRTLYASDRKSLGKDYTTAEELGEFYGDGTAILDYLKKHRTAYFTSKNTELVGCEIPILYKLRDKFYYKGFIDCLLYSKTLDRWQILDFKTSTRGWNSETKSDRLKTDQVLLYKYFLSQQFGIDIDKIDVEYFIIKRKVDENAEFSAMRKRVQEFVPNSGPRCIKRAVGEVEKFVSDVFDPENITYLDKEYKANPCEKSCKWCPFNVDCKPFLLSQNK